MAEISDEQLAVFQRGMSLLQEMSSKPNTRRDFERLVKQLRPDVETTDDVAARVAEPYVAELKETREKLDAFLTGQQERERLAAEREADQARDAAFSRLQTSGYTEDGRGAIKQLMVDRNIADPEAAAALFDRMNPKPVEGTSSWEPANWDIRGRAVEHDVDGLFKDADRWADGRIHEILREERSGNGN